VPNRSDIDRILLRLSALVLVVASGAACREGVPAGLDEDLGFSDLLFISRTPPRHAGSLVAGDGFRPGGNLVMLSPAAPSGKLANLSGLSAGDVAGVDISPDGKSALAAIRTDLHDRFHIYRLDIAAVDRGEKCFTDNGDIGSACTRLTFGPADDTRPFHLADGRIAFLREDPGGQVDFEGRGRSRTLYAISPPILHDSTTDRDTTWGPAACWTGACAWCAGPGARARRFLCRL